jgi:hypothetical protein
MKSEGTRMSKNLEKSVQHLKGSSVQVSQNNAYPPENGYDSILLDFTEGTRLRADYWRVIKNRRALVSSFDHMKKYGLPAPINATDALKNELQGQSVTEARHDKETGDLLFNFTNDVKLQVLNFTGYEIWQISFPDGTGEYSNYAK